MTLNSKSHIKLFNLLMKILEEWSRPFLIARLFKLSHRCF